MNSLYQLNNIVFIIFFILLPLPGVHASGTCDPNDCRIIIIVFGVIIAALAIFGSFYHIYYKLIVGYTKDKKKKAAITTTTRNRPIAIRRPPPTFSNRAIIIEESTHVDDNITSAGSQQLQRSEVEILPPPSYRDSQTNNSANHIVLHIINAEGRRPNNILETQTLPPPPSYFESPRSTNNS